MGIDIESVLKSFNGLVTHTVYPSTRIKLAWLGLVAFLMLIVAAK